MRLLDLSAASSLCALSMGIWGYDASNVDSLKPRKFASLDALRAQIPTVEKRGRPEFRLKKNLGCKTGRARALFSVPWNAIKERTQGVRLSLCLLGLVPETPGVLRARYICKPLSSESGINKKVKARF